MQCILRATAQCTMRTHEENQSVLAEGVMSVDHWGEREVRGGASKTTGVK